MLTKRELLRNFFPEDGEYYVISGPKYLSPENIISTISLKKDAIVLNRNNRGDIDILERGCLRDAIKTLKKSKGDHRTSFEILNDFCIPYREAENIVQS